MIRYHCRSGISRADSSAAEHRCQDANHELQAAHDTEYQVEGKLSNGNAMLIWVIWVIVMMISRVLLPVVDVFRRRHRSDARDDDEKYHRDQRADQVRSQPSSPVGAKYSYDSSNQNHRATPDSTNGVIKTVSVEYIVSSADQHEST